MDQKRPQSFCTYIQYVLLPVPVPHSSECYVGAGEIQINIFRRHGASAQKVTFYCRIIAPLFVTAVIKEQWYEVFLLSEITKLIHEPPQPNFLFIVLFIFSA
jgi:hypothetical protein